MPTAIAVNLTQNASKNGGAHNLTKRTYQCKIKIFTNLVKFSDAFLSFPFSLLGNCRFPFIFMLDSIFNCSDVLHNIFIIMKTMRKSYKRYPS
jgi:hypothetical protein